MKTNIIDLKLDQLTLQKNFVGFLFLFIVFIFSSAASTISKSDELLAFCLIISVILNLNDKKNVNKYLSSIFKITLFFLPISFIYYIKNGSIDIDTWLGFYSRILLSYNVVILTKGFFHLYFIKLIFWLCMISLIFYSIQLIVYEELFKINNLFGLTSDRGLMPSSSSLVFNIVDIHKYRNCGFMWEPGAFAAVIIFALFLAFYNNTKFDKYKIVLIISLLTTFSTTGYLALIILICYFYFPKLKIFAPILFLVLFFAISNISFISSKITSQILSVEDELLVSQNADDYSYHLNRFTSFMVDINTLTNNPILGLGIDLTTTTKKEYYKEYGQNVVRTSGLMFGLLKVGFLGMFAFLYVLQKRISLFTGKSPLGFLFCIIYLIIIFSNPLEFSSIVMLFIFI
jgi:hypothetical protein